MLKNSKKPPFGIEAPSAAVAYKETQKKEPVRITIIDYDETRLEEREVANIEECFPYKEKPSVTWINIDGLDADVVEKVGKHFDLHPLVLEAVLNAEQRPKREDFDHCILVVLKMLYYPEKNEDFVAEQVSIVLGSNFVISFQERPGDVFDGIRERIRGHKGRGRIRRMGSDYLAYALIDAVVDGYFAILEKVGEKVEPIEEHLVRNPKPEVLRDIQELKRQMIFLRKSVWPLRELISGLERGESGLIKKGTMLYLRDVYDHTIQVIDTIEALRDTISGMLEIYLSSISNKLNEIMKVLTMIATIFIPLTFIVGIYGMNFTHMPEIDWPFSYPLVWLVIVAVSVFMILYFKRKKWL